jgi:hypothetical protein
VLENEGSYIMVQFTKLLLKPMICPTIRRMFAPLVMLKGSLLVVLFRSHFFGRSRLLLGLLSVQSSLRVIATISLAII